MVLFTMSCWNLAIPLRAIGIGYNWFVWVVHCKKNGRNTSKDMIVILLHDNARPHVVKAVKKYLETFKWNVLPHPPYSLDIAPSDYWLFRRMQSPVHFFCRNRKLLQNWIASKDESFFRDGIRKLPERWEKVVAMDNTLIDLFIHFVLK